MGVRLPMAPKRLNISFKFDVRVPRDSSGMVRYNFLKMGMTRVTRLSNSWSYTIKVNLTDEEKIT